MKPWVRWLLVILTVMAIGRYVFGYHLTARGAASVPGEVLAQQEYPGGRALLVQGSGECNVVLTRRTGPIWHEFGYSGCGFEKPTHPFSWAGRGSCTTGGKYCVEAVGGTFHDPRIVTIRLGDQVQDVAGKRSFLFAGVVRELGGVFPAMEALDAQGKVLFEVSERTGFEWMAPSAP